MIEFKKVTNGERSRTYIYDRDGREVRCKVEGVTAVAVSASGTHRLETTEGKRIMPKDWVSILVDCDEWSF